MKERKRAFLEKHTTFLDKIAIIRKHDIVDDHVYEEKHFDEVNTTETKVSAPCFRWNVLKVSVTRSNLRYCSLKNSPWVVNLGCGKFFLDWNARAMSTPWTLINEYPFQTRIYQYVDRSESPTQKLQENEFSCCSECFWQ